MSLQAQLHSFVARVAALFAEIDLRIGALARLATTAKTDLVAAINELAARETSISGSAYLHTQTVPAAVWTINHNLGTRPAVAILDAGGNEIEADVTHLSMNQLVIRFAIPIAGVARLT